MAVVATVALCVLASPTSAQETSSIEGTVTSPLQCGPVPKATVVLSIGGTATDPINLEAVTDSAGRFTFPEVTVAVAQLYVTDSGFQRSQAIIIGPGVNRVDLKLEPSRSAPYYLVDCPDFWDDPGSNDLARTGPFSDAAPAAASLLIGIGILLVANSRTTLA